MNNKAPRIKSIAFVALTILVFTVSAQTKIDTSKATSVYKTTDSINGVREVIYSFNQPGQTWYLTDVSRVYSEGGLLLGECIKTIRGEGCITTVIREEITMYDQNRNYRTREMLGANKFLIKRYDNAGNLLFETKVNRRDLQDEWDIQSYKGIHLKRDIRLGGK